MSGVDRILISELSVFAHHGVLPEEREKGQEFLIDLEIEADLSEAASADDLTLTIDYAEVVEKVTDMSTNRRYNLLETLAARIAEYLVSLDGAERVTVTVRKPEAPLPARVGTVGVSVTRYRAGEAG